MITPVTPRPSSPTIAGEVGDSKARLDRVELDIQHPDDFPHRKTRKRGLTTWATGTVYVRCRTRSPSQPFSSGGGEGLTICQTFFWTDASAWRNEVNSKPVEVNLSTFPVRTDVKCHMHPMLHIKLTISFAP
jgi:hypothetical protein